MNVRRVQKVVIRLIYGKGKSYEKMLQDVKLETLQARRERLCLEFAAKALMHKKFNSWFKIVNANQPNEKARYAECKYRQKRLKNSPIPYFVNLLNKRNGNIM